jgi:hypothetical protein
MAEIKRVAARYNGSTMLLLQPGQGTGYNPDGTRRASRAIERGDVLLMPEREICGFTLFREGERAYNLGTGKCIKPEHQDLDDRELSHAGYEFHRGRPDFDLVVDQVPVVIPTEITPEQDPEPVEYHIVADQAPETKGKKQAAK